MHNTFYVWEISQIVRHNNFYVILEYIFFMYIPRV